MDNNNNQANRIGYISYMGGDPVRCPRCSNVVTERFCPFCNLDLSTVYSRPLTENQSATQDNPVTPDRPVMQDYPAYQEQNSPQGQQSAPQPLSQDDVISTYTYPVGGAHINPPQMPQGQFPPQMQQPIQPQIPPQGQYPPQMQQFNNQFNNPYNQYNQYNGYNPYNPYNQYNQPKRKRWPIIISIILAAALILVPIITTAFSVVKYYINQNSLIPFGDDFGSDFGDYGGLINPYEEEDYNYSGGVSADEYKSLKIGMNYAQVSSIIGGDGTIVDSGTTLKKETYYIYCWAGENDPNALVYITITSDVVSDITLEGTL